MSSGAAQGPHLPLDFAETDSPVPALQRAGYHALALPDFREAATAQARGGIVRPSEIKEEARACPRRGTFAGTDSSTPSRITSSAAERSAQGLNDLQRLHRPIPDRRAKLLRKLLRDVLAPR